MFLSVLAFCEFLNFKNPSIQSKVMLIFVKMTIFIQNIIIFDSKITIFVSKMTIFVSKITIFVSKMTIFISIFPHGGSHVPKFYFTIGIYY